MISTPRNEIQSHHSRPYVRLAMLSLLFLMSNRCDDIEDPSALEDPSTPLLLDLAQTSGFNLIVSGGVLPESDFFPLRAGTEWTYELVHADADTASEAFAFPTNFTASVIGIRYVDGEMYNTVANYLIPGADFSATALMREESGLVYVLIDGEEYLLYSFDSDTTQWMVPMKMGSEIIENRNAETVNLTEQSAVVSWDLSGFPGPDRPTAVDTEAGWADVFNPGLGRVRIVSMTEVYGLIVWDLKAIIASDTELVFPEPNPNSYYPLQEGNQWVYQQIEVGYDTVSVEGERIIDGKKYFEVFKSDSENPPALYRVENGVIYKKFEGEDYIILDPSRPLGETWQCPYNMSAYIASHSDTVFSNNGPIFNCIKIIIDGELDITESVYAPGVGKVSSTTQFKLGAIIGGSIGLIYAIINGDTISFTY